MNFVTNIDDGRFEDAVSGWIGNHDGRQFVLVFVNLYIFGIQQIVLPECVTLAQRSL